MSKRALIIVDVQNDFLPGGALAVKHGDQVIPVIEKLVQDEEYDLLVFTQDYHPAETEHFEKWPVHCVRGTKGAELHPDIAAMLNGEGVRIIKGTGTRDDGYSAFEGWKASISRRRQRLDDLLRDRGIEEVDVVGLAFDYCVKATAKDAAEAGFKTRVLYNATRSVSPDDEFQVMVDLRKAGAEIA